MMTPEERLVYMANQIARNLAAPGGDEAALAVADHIIAFWDPRMKAQILAMPAPPLDPIAAAAIDLIRARAVPAPQSEATAIDGGSDAG